MCKRRGGRRHGGEPLGSFGRPGAVRGFSGLWHGCGPLRPARGERRRKAAAGQRGRHGDAPVVPGGVRLFPGLYPARPPVGFGAGPGLRGPVLALLPAGAGARPGAGAPRLPPQEGPVGGFGPVGLHLLFGVEIPPLPGRVRLLQPGHLRGHVHAPELYHQPGPAGGIPPGVLHLAGDPAGLPLFGGQRVRLVVPGGRAPEFSLCPAHVVCHGAGDFRLSAVRRPAAGQLEQGPPRLDSVLLQRRPGIRIFPRRRVGEFQPDLHGVLPDPHQPGGGEHPLGERGGGHDAAPAGAALWLGGAVPPAVPAVPGGVRGPEALLLVGRGAGRAAAHDPHPLFFGVSSGMRRLDGVYSMQGPGLGPPRRPAGEGPGRAGAAGHGLPENRAPRHQPGGQPQAAVGRRGRAGPMRSGGDGLGVPPVPAG